jgi:hypothetical protein
MEEKKSENVPMDEEKDSETEGSTGPRDSADEQRDNLSCNPSGVSSNGPSRTKKAKTGGNF